jgi:hypothetical protein
MVCFLAVAYAVTVVLDPYGRLGISKSNEVGFLEERPTMVTRALNPKFDAAIIGNSSSMMLNPEDLDRKTRLHFVSLSISGTDAPANLAMMKFFLEQNATAKVVVLATLPAVWCSDTFTEDRPFPFWLYSDLPKYFLGLARNTSFELLETKFAEPEHLRIDGFHTYSFPIEKPEFADPVLVQKRLDTPPRPTVTLNPSNRFPSIDRLAIMIGASSPQVFFLILWTPRYISFIPVENSDAGRTDRACKSAMATALSRYPNVRIIDWSEADRPENHESSNFRDPIHYRSNFAKLLDTDIAASLPADLRP